MTDSPKKSPQTGLQVGKSFRNLTDVLISLPGRAFNAVYQFLKKADGPLGEKLSHMFEIVMVNSRWIIAPFLVVLLVNALELLWILILITFGWASESVLVTHTLKTLQLLDITMIGNLVWLISAGSFYVFIDTHYPDTSGIARPRALTHVSSGLLKEKMAGSIVGVSSVHLLSIFLHLSGEWSEHLDIPKFVAQVVIHLMFIGGLLAFNKCNAADHHQHDDKPAEKEHHDTHESH